MNISSNVICTPNSVNKLNLNLNLNLSKVPEQASRGLNTWGERGLNGEIAVDLSFELKQDAWNKMILRKTSMTMNWSWTDGPIFSGLV